MNFEQQQEAIKETAKTYILETYARAGNRIYIWEEWENPLDDTTAHSCSGYCPPPDYDGDYQWSEIYSCEVTNCEVDKDEDRDVFCTVYADIAIFYSFDQEDETPPEPESRELYCYMEYDKDDQDWYVIGVEE